MNPDVPENLNGIAGKPLQASADANGHVFDSLKASNTIDPLPPKPNPQESIDALHVEGPIPNLRTYQSDIEDVVKHKESSVVKIAIAEKKKQETVKTYNDPKRDIYLLALSIILIVGSACTFGVFYYLNKTHSITSVIQTPTIMADIIPTDMNIPIQISSSTPIGTQLKNTASHITTIKLGSLVHTTFTLASSTDKLDAQTFISLLSTSMPSYLSRTLGPQYEAGFQMNDTPGPFIIFKTTSYDSAFAGMLAWENAMQHDLSPFLGENSGVSTSFQDAVINNKDVRELKDSNGEAILLYSFPDKNTLVITTREATFQTIVQRLVTTQFVQ